MHCPDNALELSSCFCAPLERNSCSIANRLVLVVSKVASSVYKSCVRHCLCAACVCPGTCSLGVAVHTCLWILSCFQFGNLFIAGQLFREVQWLLIDGVNAGSGEAYDWAAVRVPPGVSSRGWLLAGGLNPTNVGQVFAAAQPTAVDVSSGVASTDGLRKDAEKVMAFMHAVKSART